MAEEIVKRKRGRPRKDETVVKKPEKLPSYSEKYEDSLIRQLFEDDIKKKLQEIEDNDESDYYEDQPNLEHRKRDGIWDVSLSEEIRYFDPELSYEITGYRPINMTQGLDFDPEPFCEAANTFLANNGKYTSYPRDCKPYNDYWNEQYRRCVEGYTVGKYRVTGDHYFFLNFYRMQTVNQNVKKGVKGRSQSFPSFVAKQYEFFHYLEMCEMTKHDCVMLKARGLGFSEIIASLGVRPFITTREFKTVFTTAAKNQLEPVLNKCWTQLNWLNMNTNGGMKRLRQKIDNIWQKRASLVDNEGTEYGRMADIEGIVADHPRKVRGERVERLFFEEAGSNPNLVTSWIQGESLVELNGEKIGIMIAGGTGGDTGPQLAGLARMFNDPTKYNALPYKNFHTRDGRVQYTGFFFPAHEFSLSDEYLDHRGVTDSVRFREYYENKRAALDGSDLLDYCAERCFTPDEALLRQGDNLFDSAVISDRITQIRVHKQGVEPQKMALIWDRSQGDETSRNKVKAIPNQNSKILIIEPPQLDPDGNHYKNLYVAGIDSIDMGTSDSASDKDVSDFCIVIKKRIHGMQEPVYVAMYKDRPRDIRTAYENAMKLLTWYNCKALLEYTKISIQMYFKEKGKGNLFMSRPEFAISQTTKKSRASKELVGVPGTEAVIKHGLELIAMYVNDYCYHINYDEMLEQLLNYSYVEKKKFDIIAAMGMAEIADEELNGIAPIVSNNVSKEWKDIGFYTDENGVKHRGTIPSQNKFQARWTFNR